MTPESLELRVIGRRISHLWCMYVVSNGYGGFSGVVLEVVDSMHACRANTWRFVG